ncbi:MAG: hypothetical protein ACTHZ5_10175 [Micrococcaceae bacterium]
MSASIAVFGPQVGWGNSLQRYLSDDGHRVWRQRVAGPTGPCDSVIVLATFLWSDSSRVRRAWIARLLSDVDKLDGALSPEVDVLLIVHAPDTPERHRDALLGILTEVARDIEMSVVTLDAADASVNALVFSDLSLIRPLAYEAGALLDEGVSGVSGVSLWVDSPEESLRDRLIAAYL